MKHKPLGIAIGLIIGGAIIAVIGLLIAIVAGKNAIVAKRAGNCWKSLGWSIVACLGAGIGALGLLIAGAGSGIGTGITVGQGAYEFAGAFTFCILAVCAVDMLIEDKCDCTPS
ncbi:MAG: hypothetical protein V2G52_04390 [bacterium JZ-2024 1]